MNIQFGDRAMLYCWILSDIRFDITLQKGQFIMVGENTVSLHCLVWFLLNLDVASS
jgi:hypothetical protein